MAERGKTRPEPHAGGRRPIAYVRPRRCAAALLSFALATTLLIVAGCGASSSEQSEPAPARERTPAAEMAVVARAGAPEATTEATFEATPVATPEPTPEATPEPTPSGGSDVARIRVELDYKGFNGAPGFVVDVRRGQRVELTFVWADTAVSDNGHRIVIEDLGLKTPLLTVDNREATLSFIADRAGSFEMKCNWRCEGHENFKDGILRVS